MVTDSVTVRQLNANEISVYKALRLEALYSEPASFISQTDDWLALPADKWREKLRTPVFVALSGGEAVGMMSLLPNEHVKIRHRATIAGVFVRESFRGSGVASRLFRVLEEYARDRKIFQLELSVIGNNPRALRFYERAGFEIVGRIPNALLDKRRRANEIIMARRIDPLSKHDEFLVHEL